MIWMFLYFVNDGLETEYVMKLKTPYATVEQCQSEARNGVAKELNRMYNEAGVPLKVSAVCKAGRDVK